MPAWDQAPIVEAKQPAWASAPLVDDPEAAQSPVEQPQQSIDTRRGRRPLPHAFSLQDGAADNTEPRQRGDAGRSVADPSAESVGKDALDLISELAAANNRGWTELIDFFGPDNVNAILNLSGSEKRVPTLTGALKDTGIQGGFMDDTAVRDVVQGVGTLIPAAMGTKGVSGRDLTKAKGAAAEFLGLGTATTPTSIAAQDLVKQGRDAGIPVLTTDAIPPKTFPGKAAQQTAEKIPLVGTAPLRQGQQVMRQDAVDKVTSKYGEFSYDAIVTSLKAQKDKVKSAAGSVLEKSGARLDGIGEVNIGRTKAAITKASSELSKPNVIKSSSADEDLKTLLDALQQPQSFTSLKENRTAFREIVNSIDPSKKSQLTSRAKSLLTSVERAMSDDMDSFAKQNLDGLEYRQWKKANSVYAEQARNLTKSRLKNVLDSGDIKPESVKTMLFSQNTSEQQLLYKSLTQDGRKNARAAIISKVVEDAGKTAGGLTPNSFVSRLNKYNSQINVFFKGKEKSELKGLMRVLDATRRAQDAAVTTPTGQQLIGGLSVTGLYLDPAATIAAAGTVGGLARLYESAPVRNALLRLGSIPKSSKNYTDAVLAAQYAIYAAANSDSEQAADK